MKTRIILISAALVLSSLLSACGGGETPEPQVGALIDVEEEISSEEAQVEMNTTGASFEEQELPADFPEEFPLPEGTKVGSTVPMPGENSYRIFFALVEFMLEDALSFYQQELQDGGWSVEAEGPEVTGYGMWITHPEYEARLSFIEDEYGVVLDLTIAPLGELEEIPGSGETFGESEGLGESEGDFPSDFPVPSRFTAIDLPSKLAEEGYVLAFTFPDMAELAIIELSTALMSGSWAIGEFEIEAMTGSYMVPFSGPGGFQGYALITSKGEVAGLSSISGAVIALHAGPLE
jgi:hypothetical protein